MTTALVFPEGHRPEPEPYRPEPMTKDQIDLIKDTIARDQNLSDDEFRLLLYTAQRLGLDPLTGQIRAIRRKGKVTLQVSVDGQRLIAARTDQFAGESRIEFVEGDPYPISASIEVYRFVQGQRCAFPATVYWVEFYPGDGPEGFMWRKMPKVMLGKTAESQALRKAFPYELSGVYTTEEMEQAGPSDTGTEAATAAQVEHLKTLLKSSAFTDAQRKHVLGQLPTLDKAGASKAIEWAHAKIKGHAGEEPTQGDAKQLPPNARSQVATGLARRAVALGIDDATFAEMVAAVGGGVTSPQDLTTDDLVELGRLIEEYADDDKPE